VQRCRSAAIIHLYIYINKYADEDSRLLALSAAFAVLEIAICVRLHGTWDMQLLGYFYGRVLVTITCPHQSGQFASELFTNQDGDRKWIRLVGLDCYTGDIGFQMINHRSELL
jgi:hypothetical protein